MPVRKPVIQKREVSSTLTGRKPLRGLLERKSATQKVSKPDRSRPAKGQSFADKKAEQRLALAV
jgi:hypothetical protein